MGLGVQDPRKGEGRCADSGYCIQCDVTRSPPLKLIDVDGDPSHQTDSGGGFHHIVARQMTGNQPWRQPNRSSA